MVKKEFRIKVRFENGESFWFPVTAVDEESALQDAERIVKSAYIDIIH